jgi:hypothetical protein
MKVIFGLAICLLSRIKFKPSSRVVLFVNIIYAKHMVVLLEIP